MKSDINLDDFLNRTQAAAMFGLSQADFDRKVRSGIIAGINMGRKTVLFHPRTMIATLMMKNGVPLELIAASFAREWTVKHEIHHHHTHTWPSVKVVGDNKTGKWVVGSEHAAQVLAESETNPIP